MWDLAVSEHGDLVLTPNRDLSGISGTDLIEQRMKIRLLVRRGSWAYDSDGTFGSNLYRLSGLSGNEAVSAINAYVREALRDMDEITIDSIQAIPDPTGDTRSILISIFYRLTDATADEGDQYDLNIALPIAGGGV